MHEQLKKFKRNNVSTLLPKSDNHTIIGTKWACRNKIDGNDIIIRNKSRLIAKGYSQEEGIDYDETFAPLARLEAKRMLLAFACVRNFKLSGNRCENCPPQWLYYRRGLCSTTI